MLRKGDGETIELTCPECGALVEAPAKDAAKGKVRCPRGHEFAVVAILGPGSDGSPS